MEEKIKSESIIDILKEELYELREKNALLERRNLDLRIENLTLKEELEKIKKRNSVGTKAVKSNLFKYRQG